MTRIKRPPSGIFEGRNFMTPGVLDFYSDRRGTYAELSVGRGISNTPIYGVTVRPEREKSQLFHSRAEAEDYIASLGEPHD